MTDELVVFHNEWEGVPAVMRAWIISYAEAYGDYRHELSESGKAWPGTESKVYERRENLRQVIVSVLRAYKADDDGMNTARIIMEVMGSPGGCEVRTINGEWKCDAHLPDGTDVTGGWRASVQLAVNACYIAWAER